MSDTRVEIRKIDLEIKSEAEILKSDDLHRSEKLAKVLQNVKTGPEATRLKTSKYITKMPSKLINLFSGQMT